MFYEGFLSTTNVFLPHKAYKSVDFNLKNSTKEKILYNFSNRTRFF